MRTDDMHSMLQEISELESYITPDMSVYKSLIQSGFDNILFRGSLLELLQILEEMLFIFLHGHECIQLSDDETKSIKWITSEILKTRLIKVDKLKSTDVEVGRLEEEAQQTKFIFKTVVPENDMLNQDSDFEEEFSQRSGFQTT